LNLLLPGPHPLFAAEAPADHLVYQQNDSLRVEIDSAQMPPLRLVVPTIDDRIKTFCRGNIAGPGKVLMLGRVLLPDRSPASGAAIEAFWAQSASDLGHGYRERARTDTLGAFHVCGLAAEDTVQVSATLDSLDAYVRDQLHVRRDSDLFQATLRLGVPPFRSRIMRVVDERGDPLANASLFDDETGELRETTNVNGEASLAWLPRGRTTVPVHRPGYSPTSATINIAPNDSTTVVVSMRRAP
jgi:hypothetical protein